MGREEQELAILVTGKDVSATRTLKGVNRELNKLPGIAGKAGRNMARNLERTVIAGVAATAGAIGYAVNKAGDFEAQLNTINTIARATPDALNAIGDSVRQIARDTGTPLEELTQGYYDLLSAGIKTADAQGVLVAANKLAIGGLATTAETVDLLTTAINTYGGDASKAGYYADIFAKAVERGKVTADEIAGSFATVGPMAAAYHIEIQEIGAAYARLTAAGVPAAEAATQMRAAIGALAKDGSKLHALEKQTGHNYLALAGRKGLVVALQQLRTDADKAGIPLQQILGRVEAVNFVLQTTGPNFDAYNADLAAMGDATGTAAGQMSERQKGLNYQMAKLKANVDDAAITIGTALLPAIGDLAAQGTDWIKNHQPEIKQFAQDLAKGIRDAVEWAKQLDWNAIADALKAGADAAKTIVQTFLGLPAPIQQLLAGGFVANKVTGGAVMDVVGLGAKLALRSMNVQAGVVNVSGGVGGAAGGAVGRGGGLLGGIARTVGFGIGADVLLNSSAANADSSINYGGGVGNIAGGALAGGSIAGPLGALVGGVTGVIKGVAEVESSINTNMARGAHSNLGSLQGVGTSDLLTKLSAIDSGINQINSNPLNVLVSGDALSELQQMRAEVVGAIEAAQEASTANLQPLPDDITKKQVAKFDTLRDRIESSKIATVSKSEQIRGSVNSSSIAIVGAIRALDLSPTINIPITLKAGTVAYGRSPTGQTLVRVGAGSGASGQGAGGAGAGS